MTHRQAKLSKAASEPKMYVHLKLHLPSPIFNLNYPRPLANLRGSLCSRELTSNQHQAMRNIQSCLQAANSSLDKIVRRRIYIIDIKQFREVDAIWAEWVGPPYPVSTCVQVSHSPSFCRF